MSKGSKGVGKAAGIAVLALFATLFVAVAYGAITSVSYIVPAENGFVRGNPHTLNVSYVGTGCGTTSCNMTFYNNDTLLPRLCGSLGNSADWDTPPSITCQYDSTNYADGVYTYNVTYYNATGEIEATNITVNVTIDNTRPAIQIISPVPNILTNSRTVLINLTATDAYLNTTNISLINSTGAILNSTLNSTNGTYAVVLTAPQDGTYNITAVARDRAGNTNTSTVSNYTIDATPPVITFVSPTDNSTMTVTRDYIRVNVTATDMTLKNITIRLYNSSGQIRNTTVSLTSPNSVTFVGLPNGIYFFNATAYDLANNASNTQTRNVTINKASSGLDWNQFAVFSGSQQPYAMNGPGCFAPGNTNTFTNGTQSPGYGCPGADNATRQSYDLGAVWVDMNSQYIAWKVHGPAIGVASTPFCNATSLGQFFLMVEFDADNNVSTGCPNGRPCRYGSEYQIKINQSGGYLRYYNLSLLNTTCQAGIDCFTTNSSVNVSLTTPRCDGQNGLRFAIPRSAISNLVGLAFEVNVINGNASAGPIGPVESLGSFGMSKMMMSGPMDMMFQGGGGCGQYNGNNASCLNATDSSNCQYNTQFGFCEPNMSAMSCSEFCGRCSNATACQAGARGKCRIVPAPPMIPPEMINFSANSQNSICVEDTAMMNMQMGGFGSCDSDCKFCSNELMCNTSSVSSSSGSGNGCKWVRDTYFNRSWCDMSTFSDTKLTCTNTTLDRCFNSTDCAGVGGTWDDSLKMCYVYGTEICFNGIDDDANGLIDCSDTDCTTTSACGGEISFLTDATILAKGGASLSQMQAMQFKMFEGMDQGPPAVIGVKASNGSVGVEVRIRSAAIKDMGSALGVGIDTGNDTAGIKSTLLCNNATGTSGFTYYYMLDIDNRNTTGCAVNISGTNRAGFEYRFEYSILQNSTSELFETRKAFRCLPDGNFSLFPAKMSGSPTDPAMGGKIACMANTAMIAIDKVDIGSPNGTIRLAIAASDNGTALGSANDSLRCPGGEASVPCDGLFYTLGTFDFKPNDCFANPMACGSTFSMIGGGKFMPFEDCMSPQDDDANGFVNCNDQACMMAPFCAGQGANLNLSSDKTAPTMYSSSAETFRDFVMLNWITNEPTNGTVRLYGSNSSSKCLANLTNTIYDNPPFEFDKFRPFHGMPLQNNTLDSNAATITLASNTTYFYRLEVCDRAGNCAMSGCLNFTTKSVGASTSFQYKFDFTPPANPLLNTTAIKIWNGSAYNNITQGAMQNQTNYMNNATLRFDNPDFNWRIEIPGIDIAKAASLNISSAFNVSNATGKMLVGMDNNKWLEIAQNLGGDTIQLTIPEGGNVLFKCQADNTSNCQDVTNNATFVAGGVGSNYTTWSIPTALGFSVYGVNQSGIVLGSDKDVYKCYPNCVAYFNLTNYNASLTGIFNITINNTDDSNGNLTYATYMWNGTAFSQGAGINVTNFTDANTAGVLPFKVEVNMSTPTAARWNFTVSFINDSGAVLNITDAAFVDAINLTSPANGTTIAALTTNYTFILYSINDTNQTCYLYTNGTITGSGNGIHATTVSLQSNWNTEGAYPWYVSCGDSAAQIGVSVTRYATFDASTPTVALNSPANMTNTTNASAVNFNWTATDNMSAVMTCNLTINGSVNASVASNNATATNYTVSLADSPYAWYVVCNDSTGHIGTSEIRNLTVDSVGPVATSVSVNESDAFYSSASGNNGITLVVAASDALSGVKYITANFSSLNQTTPLVNMTSIGGGIYRTNVTVTNVTGMNFVPLNITIFGYDNSNNLLIGQNFTTVILYNMTTPPTGPCMQWGPSTTNFSTVSNFSAVNFVLHNLANLSCLTPGGIPPGAPAWTNTYETVALINFTSINMSTPEQAQKMQGLQNAMQVNLTPPNQFGTSRIYFNTSYFVELNTTTTITLYHLPFSSQPVIIEDADIVNGINSTGNWDQGTGEGNLTFIVNHFSGYNISDNVTPTITFNSPTAFANLTNNAVSINVTLNGTKTQISRAIFNLTGVANATYAYYNSTNNTASCSATSQGSELFNCAFTITTLYDGNYTLNVSTWDYGAAAGNTNSSAINFTVASPPAVTIVAPSNGTSHKVDFVLNVTVSDDNLSLVRYWIKNATTGSNVTAWINMTNSSATTFNTTINVSAFADGNYTIQINATEGNGRINDSQSVLVYIDDTAPSISSCTPSSSSVTAGSTVPTITCTVSDNSQSFGGNVGYSCSATSTSSVGTQTSTCTATDGALNSATATASYTVTAASTGGSSGSSGTSAAQTTHTFDSIVAGATAVVPVSLSGVAVSEIDIKVANTVAAAQVTVKAVTTPDTGTPTLSIAGGGAVQSYLQITTTNIASSNVQSAKIKFSVPKTWLTQNSVTMSNVALFRLVGTTWNQLTTRVLSETSARVYFESDTPGFSLFAIFAALSLVQTGNQTVNVTQVCPPAAKRCLGNDLQTCNVGGTAWATTDVCTYTCNSTSLACDTVPSGGQPPAQPPAGQPFGGTNETLGTNFTGTGATGGPADYTLIIVAVVVVIVAGFVFYFSRMKGKHNRSFKYKYKAIR